MNNRQSIIQYLFFIMAVIAAPNCFAQTDTAKKEPAIIISTVLAYMECEECSDGELAGLVHLKDAAVPYLVRILEKGPSYARTETLRKSLEETYSKLYPGDTSSVQKKIFVDRYLEKLKTRYFVRAAFALSVIGGIEAKAALQKAAAQSYYTSYVKAAIEKALREVK